MIHFSPVQLGVNIKLNFRDQEIMNGWLSLFPDTYGEHKTIMFAAGEKR